MLHIGDLITYRYPEGKVRCRVDGIIPEPDQLYYCLTITARDNRRYVYGQEIMIPEDRADDVLTVRIRKAHTHE